MSDKLLLPEAQASVFQPRLAAWIGLNESILLQHVHYLAGKPDFGAVVDSVKWIRMTTEEWAKELPCFDAHTIRRALANLESEDSPLLISRTFSGRSKWYRVNYELLATVNGPVVRLQSRPELRKKANEKAKEAKHKVSVQVGHIDDTSVQNGQLHLSNLDTSSVQVGQLPRPLSKTSSENISPNGDSGETPQEGEGQGDSKKWNNANKKIVGDKFFELTKLPLPNEKTLGFWYGSLYEIFKMSNKDPAETCRIMGLVVKYMQDNHLTIASPKSLHWGARALVSGQELKKVKNGYSKQAKPKTKDTTERGSYTPEEWERMVESTR